MKNSHEIIDHLSPTDALSILRTLAASDEQLARRIAEIAAAHLSEVDPEEVAFVLYDELDAVEVEEVWDRAGPKRDGYVDPSEAAYGMIEEVICRDGRRYVEGRGAQPGGHCCGQGVYRG